MYSLCFNGRESSWRNEDRKEQLNLRICILGNRVYSCIETWSVKQHEGDVANWGEFSKGLFAQILLSVLLSLEKEVPFLQGGHLSHEGFMTCLKGEGWEWQGDLPASAISSNSFSIKYSICQGAIFWGSMSWTHNRHGSCCTGAQILLSC